MKKPEPVSNKVEDEASRAAPAASPAAMPAVRANELRADGLKKRYRSRVVVKDVSLGVSSGEVIGLLGPNGAGKTTCFYMMVGLVPMDGGELYLDDTRLTHMPMHRRARLGLSYLPQEASIFRRLTVGENVQAVLELYNSDPDVIRDKLDALLHDLNIGHLLASPAMSLSGGERRQGTRPARRGSPRPRPYLREVPVSSRGAAMLSAGLRLTGGLAGGVTLGLGWITARTRPSGLPGADALMPPPVTWKNSVRAS